MLVARTIWDRSNRFLRAFRAARSGNIAIAAALVAPVMLGTMGLGAEVASWYSTQRQMQHAADSAATAAATNGSESFADEAQAVAAQYGFTDGKAGVEVTALDGQPCPDGSDQCYSVTVRKPVALALSKVVGFSGDTSIDGAPATLLVASASAVRDTAPRTYCIVALAHSGASPAIRTNGAPKANIAGCNVMSNTDAVCNGHDLNADVGDAHGTNDGCGVARNSHVAAIGDQYAGLADAIPDVDCPNGFPKAPQKQHDEDLPAVNELSGTYHWPKAPQGCGDMRLTGDTIIDTDSAGAVLVIRNGNLDLNGYTLRTSDGSGLTIVFTGENNPNYSHIVTGGGTLDIAAPTTGPWSGVAIYQDPVLTRNVDISAAGNSPTWNITGLVYLPYANVTFSGAVNKSSNGASCFVLMVDSLLVNGTGSILAHGECGRAGLEMPTNPIPSRGKLVS